MTNFDMQRIENAVWTLFQYQEEIEGMAVDMKLDRCELEAMFGTLSYVRGLSEKSMVRDDVEECSHLWEYFETMDYPFEMLRKIKYRCILCGETKTEEVFYNA